MLQVHLLTLSKSTSLNDSLINQLPAAQQAKARQLGVKRKQTFLWSRLFLLQLVSDLTGTKTSDWAITERQGLPPKLCALDQIRQTNNKANQLEFSISHSGSQIAIILALFEAQSKPILGIDIEHINPTRRLDVADYFCNMAQRQNLSEIQDEDEQRRYITTLWTQKEAWFKARHIPILNAQLKALTFQPSTESVDIFSTDINPDLVLSVCCNTAEPIAISKQYRCDESTPGQHSIQPTEAATLQWRSFQSST